ncbi:sodium transporter HKT1-like [Rosa rugosa]|uniref:sodium transporter HKT1-like n=1 Tax=Rosa rugosa TaxID=74645 RepID=UPI002B401F0A|nr:sodium transporter HKT1-like [Rosa rugosa]
MARPFSHIRKMNNVFVPCRRKLEGISCNHKLPCIRQSSCKGLIRSLFRFLLFLLNPFIIELIYVLMVSVLGYLALRVTKPRTRTSFRPKDFDLFFTSVSSTTVASMSTVEMEVFSNTQLIIMTILMLAGGEVFTSLLGLQIAESKIAKFHDNKVDVELSSSNKASFDRIEFHDNKVDVELNSSNKASFDRIELGLVTLSQLESEQKPNIHNGLKTFDKDIKYKSIRCLAYVVLGYLLVVHIGGSSLVSLYIILVPSARQVLKNKGIEIQTFAVFTTVSTFANCGFVPTNENMIIFKNNSGLLLLLIPQILLGNTLYPVILRFVIWGLEKITRRVEFSYILKNHKELGYSHVLSGLHSLLLLATVLGFIAVQLILFCAMEWKSEAMDGLSGYQKFVASLFQTVNSRHAGESVVDLSIISPAILVLFVLMMYLPPYTTFDPAIGGCQEGDASGKEEIRNPRKTLLESLIFSQLTYLTIFVIFVCITERQKMMEDPLNFNVLNVVVEVISAYGNVGFTTGYSCKRRLKAEGDCIDKWYGLVGRFSTEGKFILILVMFFGRLKKFSMKQGKAWKLSEHSKYLLSVTRYVSCV